MIERLDVILKSKEGFIKSKVGEEVFQENDYYI